MTRRLQVLLDDAELKDIQKAARRRRLTVAAWVRDALRQRRAAEERPDPKEKLDAIAAAARHAYPTADIDRMLEEIEQGYRTGDAG
ncbi:MAG TPA: hypothetical protein VJZ72_03365 [Candidatus Limnocylindrales bacterium]|nr:hypothetical protein [Candidatus Limnocylindrales bacterium]